MDTFLYIMSDKKLMYEHLQCLPAHTSEQGNVIGSVRIYTCMCVPKKMVTEELGI